jgi:hypothetical protein
MWCILSLNSRNGRNRKGSLPRYGHVHQGVSLLAGGPSPNGPFSPRTRALQKPSPLIGPTPFQSMEATRENFNRTPRGSSFSRPTPSGKSLSLSLILSCAPFPSSTTSPPPPHSSPRPLPQTLAPAMDGNGAGGAAAVHHHARSPEDVFRDYRARRAGIVKALTTGQLASRAFSLPLLSSFVLFFFGCLS